MKQIKETRRRQSASRIIRRLEFGESGIFFEMPNFLRSRRNAPYLLLYVNRIKIRDEQGSVGVDLRYKIVVSEEGMFIFLFLGGKNQR